MGTQQEHEVEEEIARVVTLATSALDHPNIEDRELEKLARAALSQGGAAGNGLDGAPKTRTSVRYDGADRHPHRLHPAERHDGIFRMPRYFFDVHDGLDIRDDEGVECADLEAARQEALRASGAMLSEKKTFWTGEPWKMEVRDVSGEIVATLTFSAC